MLALLPTNFHFIFITTHDASDDISHAGHRGQGSFHGHTMIHTRQQHVDGSGGSLIAEFSGRRVYFLQGIQCCVLDLVCVGPL